MSILNMYLSMYILMLPVIQFYSSLDNSFLEAFTGLNNFAKRKFFFPASQIAFLFCLERNNYLFTLLFNTLNKTEAGIGSEQRNLTGGWFRIEGEICCSRSSHVESLVVTQKADKPKHYIILLHDWFNPYGIAFVFPRDSF